MWAGCLPINTSDQRYRSLYVSFLRAVPCRFAEKQPAAENAFEHRNSAAGDASAAVGHCRIAGPEFRFGRTSTGGPGRFSTQLIAD